MFQPTLGSGFRAAPRSAFNAIVAMVVLVGIACARGGVLTNCSEADLRVLLDQGGLVTVQCDGTISLTDALSVTRDTVLDATGHQFILDGRSSGRVLYVRTNVNFTSVNVTIADGSATNGAGLYNDGGFVVLRKCVFRANSARGIVFDIEPGRIEGGAILNLGTVTATGCAFLQNSATGGGPPPPLATTGSGLGAGGAIANRGVLSADYCTFLANSAGHNRLETPKDA